MNKFTKDLIRQQFPADFFPHELEHFSDWNMTGTFNQHDPILFSMYIKHIRQDCTHVSLPYIFPQIHRGINTKCLQQIAYSISWAGGALLLVHSLILSVLSGLLQAESPAKGVFSSVILDIEAINFLLGSQHLFSKWVCYPNRKTLGKGLTLKIRCRFVAVGLCVFLFKPLQEHLHLLSHSYPQQFRVSTPLCKMHLFLINS